jgi:alpha-1,2-mannosyltransferase
VSRFGSQTRRLALFVLASSLLANALLAASGERTGLRDTELFLRGVQGVDSWRPMMQAYAIAPLGAEHPLYPILFFQKRVKFVYPPTALLLFRALDLTLPERLWQPALDVFSWLCVALAIGFFAALLDRELVRAAPPASSVERAARLALGAGFGLCFYPLLKAYTLGQMQVVVNAAFAAFLWCWASGRRGAAGALVALMAAVKPQYGLFALWGLVRGEWRFAAAAALTGCALLACSVASFGLANHLDYLSVLSHVGRHGEAYWPNQSVNGFLNRLLGNGESAFWDPSSYPPFHPLVYAGTLVGSLALLAAGLFAPPGFRRRGDAVDLAGFACALTLASPLAWEHHYGVLLPIFAVALGAALEQRAKARTTWPVLALCALVASNYWDALGRLSGTVWNPLQSLLFVSALALLALLLAMRRGSGASREKLPPIG